MDDIFNANNTKLSELFGNDAVVSDGNSLTFDSRKPSLVNQLSHGFEIWCSVSDVRFNEFEHFQGSSVQSNKSGVVDLSQSQQLQDLSRLRINTINTADSNDNSESGLRFNEEVSALSSLSSQLHQ